MRALDFELEKFIGKNSLARNRLTRKNEPIYTNKLINRRDYCNEMAYWILVELYVCMYTMVSRQVQTSRS